MSHPNSTVPIDAAAEQTLDPSDWAGFRARVIGVSEFDIRLLCHVSTRSIAPSW